MTADDFTTAARAEAERVHYPSPSSRTPSALNRATAAAFRDGASWARAHLAAQDLQVTIQRNEGEPAVCEVRQGGVLIFSGLDRSAGVRVAAQEPTDAEVVAALGAANRTTLSGSRFDAPLNFYAGNVVEGMRAALRAARDVRGQG